MSDDEIPPVAAHLRTRWQAGLKSFADPAQLRVAAPPFHAHSINMLYLRCTFDPAAARAALPAQFENDADFTGTIVVIEVGGGLVFGAYNGGFAGLAVRGFDAPDGDFATFKHTDYRSGRAAEVFAEIYDRITQPGWGRITSSGNSLLGEVGAGDDVILRVHARRTGIVTEPIAGRNHYLTTNRRGEDVLHSTDFGIRAEDLEDVRIEITDHAPPLLRSLRPTGVVWPMYCENANLTFSPPRPAWPEAPHLVGHQSRAELLDLLSQLKRAALIVAADGTVRHANAEARAMEGLSVGIMSGTLRARSAADQAGLRAAIAGTMKSGQPAEPVALTLRPGEWPVIVQVMPLGSPPDSAEALMLLTDPNNPDQRDARDTLRLLGLTAAEARLAALIGAGRSPRDAAEALAITESTARTTLRDIFSKLRISRQSELATLVTRLQVS